jgi:hypothetical protein
MPPDFANRLEANWRILLAIAELCGAGKEACDAATALARRNDEASLGVELLRDIRSIFDTGLDRITSEDLVTKLVAMSERPWAEMPITGRAITQRQLAHLLKPFKAAPNQSPLRGEDPQRLQGRVVREGLSLHPDKRRRAGGRIWGNSETNAEISQKIRNTCFG